jgi:L-ascorbate metabolism protein UlaG (beta-lactamase superfamily)
MLMHIKWFGHSCFKVTSERGIGVLTDPFDSSVGYKMPNADADIVTVSHDHFDHNFTDAVNGEFELINKIGLFHVRDMNIKGIASFHDKSGGKKRGSNIIYVFDVDGIRVCHLGDLGHILGNKELDEIGGIDVLMIPVGGNFTIDASEAVEVVNQLNPSIIIPMHFKTPAMNFPIDTVEVFLQKMGGGEKLSSQVLEITRDDLTDRKRICVLRYE